MVDLSVFDIIKVGIGPSSSHTMGPWQAALTFINYIDKSYDIKTIEDIKVYLYGSLAKTGKGHGTDVACVMGLLGYDYKTVDPNIIPEEISRLKETKTLNIKNKHTITFHFDKDIVFNFKEYLKGHPNGMIIKATLQNKKEVSQTYYSIGGGFIVQDDEGPINNAQEISSSSNAESASNLIEQCKQYNFDKLSDLIYQQEQRFRSLSEIQSEALNIWLEIKNSIYRGLLRKGTLPGGLNVEYRSGPIAEKLLNGLLYNNIDELFNTIKQEKADFNYVNKWTSCFAMAVNEENASFSRIVTSPTNGAAGVLPAVLTYAYLFTDAFKNLPEADAITRFILTAGKIGCLFKKNATISAAMGGCQAEIGVSSSMSAAALTEALGGSIEQSLQAAEIAMEHHLGLTCDPINGLVQIPCIERNSMGAIKAITASNLALNENPKNRLINLDTAIKSMWQTSLDMNSKYKETAEAGLAAQFTDRRLSEC
ncbi:MAG: L-serine ammonia-lyase [Solitalea-like symbiont of Acarus siro]